MDSVDYALVATENPKNIPIALHVISTENLILVNIFVVGSYVYSTSISLHRA